MDKKKYEVSSTARLSVRITVAYGCLRRAGTATAAQQQQEELPILLEKPRGTAASEEKLAANSSHLKIFRSALINCPAAINISL